MHDFNDGNEKRLSGGLCLEIKNEFWIVGVVSILFMILAGVKELGLFRAILGLPFVLFFPGYALMAALFPGKRDLDGLERVVLSFALSIAVVPLLGLLLNQTYWGIRLYPILITIFLFTLFMSLISIYRRRKITLEERFKISWHLNLPKWGELCKFQKIMSVTLAGIIVLVLGILCYIAAVPNSGERYTEFYVLGPGGKAEDYPRSLKIDENEVVALGVVNHEYRKVTYNIEVRLDGSKNQDIGPIKLEHGQKWQESIGLLVPETFQKEKIRNVDEITSKKIKVEFLLTKDGLNELYKSLHLWADVKQ